MTMGIRQATLDDLPVLINLGELMHAESPRFSRITFSPARLGHTLAALVQSPMGFVWVTETEAGEVVGGLMATAFQHWASDDLMTTDLALFLAPEHRGGTAAARLTRKYHQWARDLGAKLIQQGVTTGVHTDQTVQLLERLGMKRCGVILEA
ncbi:hypothetical protein P353_22335 [Comamonas testosteroni]|uniref:N-acetyltransferase domain-containing protein n=2 Tax=Comamonas testosteroni TaxID=285 RepID=A0A096F7E3_COMTE|nr:hypothetical protein P353_22335 [Comamonas testosteroni]